MGIFDLIRSTPKRTSLGTLNKRSSRKGCLVCVTTVFLVLVGSMCGLTIKFKFRTNPRNVRSISDRVLQENMQGQPLQVLLEHRKRRTFEEYEDKKGDSEQAPDGETTTLALSDEETVGHTREKSNDRKLLGNEEPQNDVGGLSKEDEENRQFLMLLRQSETQLGGSQRLLRRDVSTNENELVEANERDNTPDTTLPPTAPVSKKKKQHKRSISESKGDDIQKERSSLKNEVVDSHHVPNKVERVSHQDAEDSLDNVPVKALPGNSKVTKSIRGVKIILLYTTLFDNVRWPDLSDREIVDYPKRARCRYHESCKLTYDKNAITHADAVIFHGVDLFTKKEYSPSKLRLLGKRRPSYQRWVFFMHEHPTHFQRSTHYSGMFNWTMTYEHGSDIFLPYSHYRVLSASEEKSVQLKDYASEKMYTAAFVVNECNPLVIEYVRALTKYIDISVYGNCAVQIGVPAKRCSNEPGGCSAVFKRYKFFISFERAFCKDYISNIFWEPLLRYESVPVVLGANYDTAVVPPHSFVDASQYPSVKSLANYLRYLSEDDVAYNSFFSWKEKYRIEGYDKICKLCEGLHQTNLPAKSYKDVWSTEKFCKKYDRKVERIRKILQRDRQQ